MWTYKRGLPQMLGTVNCCTTRTIIHDEAVLKKFENFSVYLSGFNFFELHV